MAHRGPDASASWTSTDGTAWLGHRRLSIVDLSAAGNQPMQNETGSLHLVCNGEIYNYPSLRAELEAAGHVFSSHSDSEIVLHGYEQWGTQCVERFEGMFAFILYDETNKNLFAARDRVGQKPLFYELSNDSVSLASELGALLELRGSTPDINPTAFAYIMTTGVVPHPHSVWNGIQMLPPGHSCTWTAQQGFRSAAYWQPPTEIDAARQGTAWDALFEDVLREHLMSDVPLGLFLSSGLDSVSLAAGFHDLHAQMQALTISFADTPDDEGPLAAAVAHHLDLPHELVPLQTQGASALLSAVYKFYDQPQARTGMLTTWAVCSAAAAKYKVCFSGHGGDELLGGYKWYRDLDRGPKLLSPAKRKLLRPLVRSHSPAAHRAAVYHFKHSSALHRHTNRVFSCFLPEEAEFLWSSFGLRFSDDDMLEPMRRYYVDRLPLKRALQRIDLMTFCTDAGLTKMDTSGMAHSLEVRVPMLDRRLLEWALTRPVQPNEEIESKQLLREFLRARVPEAVLKKPKQGFSYRGLDTFDWNGAIEEIRRGYWVREKVWPAGWEKLLDAGYQNRHGRIWALLNLTRWADVRMGW
jgi:asparagine synthase (glutamine-hydrolysing)